MGVIGAARSVRHGHLGSRKSRAVDPSEGRGQLRGVPRYLHLVKMCQSLGVLTPEDEFPVWRGAGGPVRIAPLFLLYDLHFPGARYGYQRSLTCIRLRDRVVCTDEHFSASGPVSHPGGVVPGLGWPRRNAGSTHMTRTFRLSW